MDNDKNEKRMKTNAFFITNRKTRKKRYEGVSKWNWNAVPVNSHLTHPDNNYNLKNIKCSNYINPHGVSTRVIL